MTSQLLGELPNGDPVHQITIRSEMLTAKIITLGARLSELFYDNSESLVPSHTLNEFLGPQRYSGAIITPVLNRLDKATSPLKDKVLSFTPNEGENLLHSGNESGCDRNWEIIEASSNEVALSLNQKAGEFPGNRRIEVRYVVEGADLIVSIAATTDATTLMNPGFHPYWCISMNGHNSHQIVTVAEKYLELRDDKIPTGRVLAVDDTKFDLRTEKSPSFEIDTCFVLPKRSEPEFAVALTSNDLRLDVLTDAPAFHLYTGDPSGIAIEPEIHPDAPNHGHFPSIQLDPGECFRQTTIHRFSRN